MGKGRPRAVEKGVLGQSSRITSLSGSLNVPPGPVYYPTEEEFKDPLGFISKIRPEAELYGICKIVPPKNWKPPFAIDINSFAFPTKTQAIHQLQSRAAACDGKTFELEYNRFLEESGGKKVKKKIVFEGDELDLCKLFNAVKRYGGYKKVVKEKKWGDVFRILGSGGKISECAKHVLCQLYLEHLCDYEDYCIQLNKEKHINCKRRARRESKSEQQHGNSISKRRRRNPERSKVCKAHQEDGDQICEQCKSGLHGEVMLLCDRCNRGWHVYCLSPPLEQVPAGNWYCLECLSSEKDIFGFVPGKKLSLEAFRRVADRAKKKWFGSVPNSRVQVERKFWEIVEGSVGEVEVMYGSDLDTSVYGSGFPRISDKIPQSVEFEVWDEYCSSPWNLNNLPKLQGSMLQAVRQSITGVMVPWLYIGMLFSSFCWHFEDHCFYSMNYLHWGEAKCWYSVPGTEASAFEKVMRNSLPDLFDAQPDLLFQLVTMLNPSVLQENSVPVYSVLQEPGNFVITFPRSYHAGFNFGLNCAEAVNFAPADWFPHGGYGAGLYQLYHKAAVLSHEELLCVAAKTDFDGKTSLYLKNELFRIYDKEKTWRERLWRNGIIKFSPMPPRKHPEYVDSEDDPMCIICQQFLYLSAVSCHCQPSVFVCLEHWEHLCECKPNNHHLLYRHTLAELKGLVFVVDKRILDATLPNKIFLEQSTTSSERDALSKKVKGGYVTLSQLAEEWLTKAYEIIQSSYSPDAYAMALKEAEQFLWAGCEMDRMRDMKNNLVQARNWAEDVRMCLSKIELWSLHKNNDTEKVQLEHVHMLLEFNPIPCREAGCHKLKDYERDARLLIHEIEHALSTWSKIADLENLYAKACDLPLFLKESDKLSVRLSSAKAWIQSLRECVSQKIPATIEAEYIENLAARNMELKVQDAEYESLLDLVRQVESCKSSCNAMLMGAINFQNLELFLKKWDDFIVKVPELELLRKYHHDIVLWISRLDDILATIQEREDQQAVVEELTSIQKDGALLKVEVNMLPRVMVELKKACWRVKALKALQCKMSMDYIKQLLTDGNKLQMDSEKLFSKISEVLEAAFCWQDRVKNILEIGAQMSDFEDAIRTSECINIILPSLDDIKNAALMVNSWLDKAKPFLMYNPSASSASSSLLKLETLKELVIASKQLKVSLVESSIIQSILEKCNQWELDATSVLQDAEFTLNSTSLDEVVSSGFSAKIECQVSTVETVLRAGFSLGFDFKIIQKLHDAFSTLEWCFKALSLHAVAPTFKEVETLLEAATHLSTSCVTGSLYSSLIEGVNWLKKALEILQPSNIRCNLSEAEDVLEQSQSQVINMFFPSKVSKLAHAIQKHNLWLDQVHLFFGLKLEHRSWALLLKLKEVGSTDTFNCSELDMVLFEVRKIELWKQRCEKISGLSLKNNKKFLDRALSIFNKSKSIEGGDICSNCFNSSVNWEFLDCSICKCCYHLQCIGSSIGTTRIYTCPFCHFTTSGKLSRNGISPLTDKGNYPDVDDLIQLLSDSEDLCLLVEERATLHEVVEEALACRSSLFDILDFTLDFLDKDLNVVAEKLSVALKAVEVSRVFDSHCKRKFDLALARNSWRVRAHKLLDGLPRPSIQQIQRHLKEGQAISINSKDHYMQKLSEIIQLGLMWVDKAKKVAMDSGALALDEVFELLKDGENLPVHCEKELKLLRDRSMLYCICRKPYDQRAMIACDQCDEWYHFDCIGLSSLPNIYICPACKLQTEENVASLKNWERSNNGEFEEPQTPSPRRRELKTKSRNPKSRRITVAANKDSTMRRSSGIERLFWSNRKPFRRVTRKRSEFRILSPLVHIQNEFLV